MDILFIVVLGAGLIYLWNRADRLEARLRQFEGLVEILSGELAQFRGGEQPAHNPVRQEPVKAARAPVPARRLPEKEVAQSEPEPLQHPEPMIDSAPSADETGPPKAKPEASRFTMPKLSFDFEDIFGRLLPIWAGGVTLAVAGFFLVKYSIEQGLLGPQVRVALGFLFGGLLLGGAELAYRNEKRVRDERVRQALAGAGLATLYASFYLAGNMYGLVGNTVAFLGLVSVTGAAILLSFRFGLPSAILGLVGGFAAPMLVGSEEANLPLLALYLALVTAGLTYAGNRQGRSWLALAALAGGLGWGALMLLSGITGMTDILALGGYLVVLGAILPAFTDGRDAQPLVRLGAAALAAVQMALMVEQAGFAPMSWALYGLLAAALSFFAWREPRMRPSTAFAAALSAMLLAMWGEYSLESYITVATGLTAIFAGVPLANIWRDGHRKEDVYQLAGFALALSIITYFQFAWLGNMVPLAAACCAIAILPALAAYLLWPKREEKLGHDGTVLVSSAAVATVIAGLIATPLWAAPLVFAVVTLALIALSWSRDDDMAFTAITWTGVSVTTLGLLTTPGIEAEFGRLAGMGAVENRLHSLLRWSATLAPFVALALRKRSAVWTAIAEAGSVSLGYGIIAQFIHGDALAWLAAGAAMAMAFAIPERLAARCTAMGLTLLWVLMPLGMWGALAIFSLTGEPMMANGDLGWAEIGLKMLPAITAIATISWRPAGLSDLAKRPLMIAGGVLSLMAVHTAFKQFLAIETMERFAKSGLLERTIWEALLLAGSVLVAKLFSERNWVKPVSATLAAAALAHFALYSLMLHNPLWAEQYVGGLPLANLLLPAFAVGLLAIWWLPRQLRGVFQTPQWLWGSASMALITLLGFSELRQIFSGALLYAEPVTQAEDLLRSLLGIVLAILFLLWGSRTNSRSWRIGSLVLMLVAVLKVFLLDASGLEGLVRIASFVALGFSLIGIGWFYARQLRQRDDREI